MTAWCRFVSVGLELACINLNPVIEEDEIFYEKSTDPNGIQNPAFLTVEKPVNKFLEVTKVCLYRPFYNFGHNLATF